MRHQTQNMAECAAGVSDLACAQHESRKAQWHTSRSASDTLSLRGKRHHQSAQQSGPHNDIRCHLLKALQSRYCEVALREHPTRRSTVLGQSHSSLNGGSLLQGGIDRLMPPAPPLDADTPLDAALLLDVDTLRDP